ncbi:MAG: hypothetical protein ACYSYL_16140 [Planctomycetota bacterium]|jgi:hypothetical protein
MNTQQNQVPRNSEKLKEIPKWARLYAESRTAPLIIFSLIFIVLFGGASLGVYCFLKGKFVLAVIMMALYVAGFLYFVITWDRHEAHYFTKTGIPQSKSVQQIRKFLPLPLILFFVISVIMEQRGVFPPYVRVPISAVYVCPLLIFANWRWGRGSFIGYLWAALYGGWAIAILFKVPILTFSEGGVRQLKPGDEIYLAVPVTGLITGLIAYIYSRYALKKLKTTAHLQENTNEQ